MRLGKTTRARLAIKTSDFTTRFYGVILAAGFSSRAGSFKLELPLAGVPVLHRVLAAAAQAVDSLIVVTGHQRERVEALVASFKERYQPGIAISLAHNPLYPEGMFSSVVAGLGAVSPGEYALVQPGDSPLVAAPTWQGLIAAARTFATQGGESPVLIPTHQGKKGHPVLIPPRAVKAIAADPSLGRSGNLKQALLAYPQDLIEFPDQGVLLDLDTPEDYQNLIRRAEGKPKNDVGMG